MQRTTNDDANANAFTSSSALARRATYDDRMANAPLTIALRERYVTMRQSNAQRAFMPRAPRDARVMRCANCERALAQCERAPCTRTTTRNAYERNDARNVHRAPDPSCHHPLVKCVHKW